jgi:hypothetical protein
VVLLPEPKRLDLDEISGENELLKGEALRTGTKAN